MNVICMLIFFVLFLVSFISLLRFSKKESVPQKSVLTVLCIFFALSLVGCYCSSEANSAYVRVLDSIDSNNPVVSRSSFVDSEMTIGQKNALETARSYLSYSSFSYSGLIEQLEYEKYSLSDATFAADNCGADWYEQAFKMAKSYMDYSSFSRDRLIEQLEYEGFTHEQAVYGVEQNGY